MDGLERFVDLLRSQNIVCDLWLDGSFMTEKLDPNDVDVVLHVHSSFYENGTDNQQALLDLVLTADFKSDYFCDAFLCWEYDKSDELYWDGEWWRAYWIRQFGFSRGVQTKGMALIQLR
jgi:hypothetical protein